MSTPQPTVETLAQEWTSDPRWRGVRRDYGPEEVLRLRTVVQPDHTVARHGAHGCGTCSASAATSAPSAR